MRRCERRRIRATVARRIGRGRCRGRFRAGPARASRKPSAYARTRFACGVAIADGGVEALKASIAAPGPAPVKSEAALRVVTPLLEAPVANRRNWTIARLISEIKRERGVRIGRSQLSKTLRKKKKLPLAAAATLKGRQIAGEIARVGLRLQLRKAQAEAGDIVLLYGDESEALRRTLIWRGRGPSAAPICACRGRDEPKKWR